MTTSSATDSATSSATDRATDGTIWVDAAPFRAHLLFLSGTSGVSWPVLAALAGVSQRGARALIVGRGRQPLRRLHPGIASRVLALDEARVRGAARHQVGAEHVRNRLLALMAAGWSAAGLADRIRMPLAAAGLDSLLQEHGSRPAACTELTAAVVAALVILCGNDAPPRPQATTAPTRARRPVRAVGAVAAVAAVATETWDRAA